MTTAYEWDQNHGLPSVHECITTLYDHTPLYKEIAEHPQYDITFRMGQPLALLSGHSEREVFRKEFRAQTFLREHAHKPKKPDVSEQDIEKKLKEVMSELWDAVHRRCKYLEEYKETSLLTWTTDLVFKVSKLMAMAPVPAKGTLERYRIYSGSGYGHSKRAANGQMLSMYGTRGKPVPGYLTTSCDDDLQPMASFLRDWLMNPVVDFVVVPFLKFLHWVRILPKAPDEKLLENVRNSVIEGIAEAIVSTLAILSLAVAIGTLSVIQRTELRIVVMTLFSFAFALSAQFMGRRSIPVYGLITGSVLQPWTV
ncbi:hypothetical protein J1614_002676 [Plenodomus biglobosus]|nr:hypothetical protein J1614_002676 [Plenodomus biglobosus]